MERFDAGAALAQLHQKTFNRVLVAMAVAKGTHGAREFALAKIHGGAWRDTPNIPVLIEQAIDSVAHTRAAVGAVTLDESWSTAASSFVEPLRAESVVGQLSGARRMPAQASALARITGAGAAWVSEGSSIPVYTASFDFVALMPLKVAGMVVATDDFLQLASRDDLAAQQLANDLREAIREQLDATFASDAAAVAGESPAGIGENASVISSTGSTAAQVAADLGSMIDVLTSAGISLRTATWITSEPALAHFRLLGVTDDAGTLAGLPVLASSGAAGSVMLVAAERVQVLFGAAITIKASAEGSVEMSDSPVHDAVTPTPSNLVSLFATNSTALRGTLYANWEVGGPVDTAGNSSAVVSLTGATYA